MDEHRKYVRSPEAKTGRCDWCKTEKTDLSSTRDYEEGMAGPVYRVCGECRKRRDERIRKDLEEQDRSFPDYDGYEGDD